jgi:transposase-like protein
MKGVGIMAQRRNFGKDFKAKVALEAIKGEKTINEIAGIYEVHPSMINKWKKLALEKLPDVMADSRTKCRKASPSGESRQAQPVDEEKLHQKIGQQAIEIDFLKEKLRQMGLLNE